MGERVQTQCLGHFTTPPHGADRQLHDETDAKMVEGNLSNEPVTFVATQNGVWLASSKLTTFS